MTVKELKNMATEDLQNLLHDVEHQIKYMDVSLRTIVLRDDIEDELNNRNYE